MSKHQIHFSPAQDMSNLADNTVDLVITSPPYPMIEMWDKIMIQQNKQIKDAFEYKKYNKVFELMHIELDKVWQECFRVLKEGGIACINIGDATRTLDKNFALYPNHARIIQGCLQIGFQNLPNIIWRKQTNAPNKFMGSGMLPPGAYVTLEHEFILIFRKGRKREFKSDAEKERRRRSAFFWEERNQWFSDLWDIKGTSQKLLDKQTRERSAAYPFQLPYRLINMFSVQDDTVLDPFMGTGTTTLAAIATQRNSIGFEIDPQLEGTIAENILGKETLLNTYANNRLEQHRTFVKEREAKQPQKPFKYTNENYGFPVITKQEIHIQIPLIKEINYKDGVFNVKY